MKVWITKYALTSTGIIEADDGTINEEGKLCNVPSVSQSRVFRKPDWHLSESAAHMRARQMQKKTAFSLEVKAEKIRALKFE